MAKVEAKSILLPTGESMTNPGAGGYNYLGILKLEDILVSDMKVKVKECYFKRFILKSKINSRNLSLGIKSCAITTEKYSAAILDWTQAEIC